MKHFIKRFLSTLLAITMVLGMFTSGSVSASALTDKACEIGATQYDTLGEALTDVQNGETIRLLKDITYNSGVVISGKSITFDTDTFVLNVSNYSGTGLRVLNGGTVILKGSGEFTALGTDYGVYADGSTVTLTNARGDAGTGAYAINGGDITVNGFASGSSSGAYAKGNTSKIVVRTRAYGQNNAGAYSNDGGNVTVYGEVEGYKGCVATQEGSLVTVNGTSKGGNGAGASADHGGQITVNGKVSSTYSYAVYAESDSKITVVGDVQADKGIYSGGNAAGKFGEVVVTGNVTSNNTGVYAVYGGKIHINGNVEGYYVGANCEEGDIFISGNVQGKIAVAAMSRKCNVTIGGDVKSNWADGTGVSISGSAMPTTEVSGTVRVDGVITAAGRYIEINGVVKDASAGSQDFVHTKVGYYTYSELNQTPMVLKGSEYAFSFVWVKKVTEKVCEIGSTQYATFAEALAAVTDGQTIKLLKNINHNAGILIDGKSITFDVGSFVLNVKTNLGPGLEVRNNGNAALAGSGAFNVETSFSSGRGVLVSGASSATVTNTKSIGTFGYGVYTTEPGDSVTVLGDVVVTSQFGRGVMVWTGGTVTIEGTITTAYGMYSMTFGSAILNPGDGIPDPDKPGYTKYSWPDTEGVVWIKLPSQVGETFHQTYGGVLLKFRILTENSWNNTVEVAFSNNYQGLTSFEIPETVSHEGVLYDVTAIGEKAFYNCESAISIIIPAGITDIGNEAFGNCYNLTIYGFEYSYAETYADQNFIGFVAFGEAVVIATGNYSCVIDSENGVIYGLAPSINSLEGYALVAPGYSLQYVTTAAGFGTGTLVNVVETESTESVASFTIVIFGDINGDGNIDSTDAGLAMDYENYKVSWDVQIDAAYLKAADLNGDGAIDSIDAGMAIDAENGLLTIDQVRAMPS